MDFEIKGQWYLPEHPAKRVSGTLVYRTEKGIFLELFGELSLTSLDIPVILGVSSESKPITLYKCRTSRIGGVTFRQDEETGTVITEYSVLYIFENLHAARPEQLKFTRISAELHNLAEWVGISGFKNRLPKNFHAKVQRYEFDLHYKLPDPISFKINDKTEGAINFVVSIPGLSEYNGTQTLAQKVQIMFDFKEAAAIDEALSYLLGFQKFLMLALYAPSYPHSMTLISSSGEKKRKVTLHFSGSSDVKYEKIKFASDMLFSYGSIRSRFPKIIRTWFEKQADLEPAYNLLIEQLYKRSAFTVNNFLNLAQGAETYHARTDNHTRIPKARYDKMKADILSSVDKKHHDWLNEQFNFGNSLNLHARLTEITHKASFPLLDDILGDKEQFVKQVKWSRNYYTHYSASGKKNALKDAELFYLSEKLKILLLCKILIDIGISKATLQNNLERNKYKLFYGILIHNPKKK